MADTWARESPQRFTLRRKGVLVGVVSWDEERQGWAGVVTWGGLDVEVGVYAGEVGYAQRAVERRLNG